MPTPFRKALLLIAFVFATPALPLAAQTSAPPPAVTVALPLHRSVTEWDEHIARLEPSARVELRARVSGQVEQVHFRDGQVVRAGDLLFTIDQRPFDIAAESARAALAQTQAKLACARQEIDRTSTLVRNSFAPQT